MSKLWDIISELPKKVRFERPKLRIVRYKLRITNEIVKNSDINTHFVRKSPNCEIKTYNWVVFLFHGKNTLPYVSAFKLKKIKKVDF